MLSSVNPTNPLLRRLGVGVVTLVIDAPIAFVLFAMGLLVDERVMFPLATLVIAVFTALVASWTAWRLVGDGMRTEVNSVVTHNVGWAIVPAAFIVVYVYMPRVAPVWVMVAVLVYTVLAATRLAFRHRTTEGSTGRGLAKSAAWLAGTGLAVAVILFVASRFGLTGA